MIVFIKECTITSVQAYVDDGLCQAADAHRKKVCQFYIGTIGIISIIYYRIIFITTSMHFLDCLHI